MSNVIPFQKRPHREYKFQPDGYLWLILKSLTHMFGDDDFLKASYINKHCPHISMAMLERFQVEAMESCKTYFREIKEGKSSSF